MGGNWIAPIEDRTGSKPISPIPTTIPIRQTLNFVTLNDIYACYSRVAIITTILGIPLYEEKGSSTYHQWN